MTQKAKMSTDRELIRLACSLSGVGLDVDRKGGVIQNASIITRGPTIGHGFDVDDIMLEQVADAINSHPKGVKCRLTHPENSGGIFGGGTDSVEVMLGRCRNARVDDGQVRGDIAFGNFADQSPRGKLRTYLLSIAKEDPELIGLSIVFIPDEYEQRTDESDQTLPVAGRVKDVLAVDFVGDPGANPGGLLSAEDKNKEVMEMTTVNKKDDNGKGNGQTTATEELRAEEILAADRKRREDIMTLAEQHGLDKEVAQGFCDRGVSLANVRTLIETATPLLKTGSNARIHVGEDRARDNLEAGIADAIMLRSGVPLVEFDQHGLAVTDLATRKPVYRKASDRSRQFGQLPLSEMARTYLSAIGFPIMGLSPAAVVRTALNPREYVYLTHSSSDFPYILENTLRKSLRAAYIELKPSWPLWCRKATTPDFKEVSRPQLGGIGSLPSIPEGAPYEYVTIGEGKEVYTLVKYGSAFGLTWEAIVNDDLGVFNRIQPTMAATARRKEDEVSIGILTANAALADGTALFHADHSNLAAGGDVGTLSVATLGVAQAAMRKQTVLGTTDAYLNLVPAVLIVPAALETTGRQILMSEYDPAANMGHVANPWKDQMSLVIHPLLDANSATAYYLAANSNQIDTVEVCFLESEPQPTITRDEGFDCDTMKFKVRHCVAAKALEFRGLYKNPGA